MKFRRDAHTNTIHARTKFGIKQRRRRDAPCREKLHLSKAVKSYLTFVMATHMKIWMFFVQPPRTTRLGQPHTSGTHLEYVSIIIRTSDDTERIERTTLKNAQTDENTLQREKSA